MLCLGIKRREIMQHKPGSAIKQNMISAELGMQGNTNTRRELLLYLIFKEIFLLGARCCLGFTRITVNHWVRPPRSAPVTTSKEASLSFCWFLVLFFSLKPWRWHASAFSVVQKHFRNLGAPSKVGFHVPRVDFCGDSHKTVLCKVVLAKCL